MKKWFFGEKKHLDREKIEQAAKDRRNLRWMMDNASDEVVLQYLKGMRPDASPIVLQTLLDEFHRQQAARQAERLRDV
jgi:hypothetical protein